MYTDESPITFGTPVYDLDTIPSANRPITAYPPPPSYPNFLKPDKLGEIPV
jgi:hypothetical protein